MGEGHSQTRPSWLDQVTHSGRTADSNVWIGQQGAQTLRETERHTAGACRGTQARVCKHVHTSRAPETPLRLRLASQLLKALQMGGEGVSHATVQP